MAARRVTLTAALKKLLFLLFALTSLLSAAERPNLIVVILVDAMGFADLGFTFDLIDNLTERREIDTARLSQR